MTMNAIGLSDVGVGSKLVTLPRFTSKGSELRPGQFLDRGEALVTKNGGVLFMQPQGNLVLYAPNGKGQHTALWWTANHNTPAVRATMLSDGTLVLTDPSGKQIWSTDRRAPSTRIVFQDDGNLVWYDQNGKAIRSTVTSHWKINPQLAPDDGNVFSDIVSAASDIVTAPARAIASVASHIPVIGDVTHIVSDAASAPLKLANSIASGARIDRALADHFKAQLKTVKDAAPYAQTVVSLLPGIGTGVSAAVSAGIALAEGQDITDIAKSAIRGALPGGAVAAAAFDTALKVAAGENVGQAALESARNLVPDGPARKAFDVGLAVVTGEKIQTALARELSTLAPQQMGPLLVAAQKTIASTPGLADALRQVAPGGATQGFHLAAGLLSQAGIGEKALSAVRAQLSAELRQGFDAALRTQEGNVAWLKNVTSPRGAPVKLQAVAPRPAAPVKLQAVAPRPPVKLQAVAPKPPTAPVKPPALHAATAPSAPVAGAYAPYPPNMAGGPVAGLGASEAWRWFVVYANGSPITQQGPRWLSDYDALREAAGFLESTQGRGYVGTVARWDWDPGARRWRQAHDGGSLGGGGHGGHHGGHGGHHGGHGGGRRFPQRVFAGRQWESRWGAPWYPGIVERTETCRTWGEPTSMDHSVEIAGKAALGASGGRPTTVRGPDGLLYLFAFENGIMTARPCTATVTA
jgi:hypothetical protein